MVGAVETAIGTAQGIAAQIDRPLLASRRRHMDMQDGLVLDLDEADPVITKQVDADLLRVVEPGPELIDHLLGISDAGQLEMATGSLTHPRKISPPRVLANAL